MAVGGKVITAPPEHESLPAGQKWMNYPILCVQKSETRPSPYSICFETPMLVASVQRPWRKQFCPAERLCLRRPSVFPLNASRSGNQIKTERRFKLSKLAALADLRGKVEGSKGRCGLEQELVGEERRAKDRRHMGGNARTWVFPRASERRVLLIAGVCYTYSHLHIGGGL